MRCNLRRSFAGTARAASFAITAGLLAAGCTWNGPVRALSAGANPTLAVDRDPDGALILRSQQKHLVSVLARTDRFSHDSRSLPTFYVLVTNGTGQPVTLKPTDVTASSGTLPVTLLSPPALQERMDRELVYRPGSYPVGLRDASQPAEMRSIHGSIVNPRVEPYPELKFKIPPHIAEQALQSQVIPAGETGGGRIVLESREILSDEPLTVTVTVAGEKHAFGFDVRY